MAGRLRVALLDLLVERAEFGHGGNMEVIAPLAERFDSVEVLLLTPQCQSAEVTARAAVSDGPVTLTSADVPRWDDDFPFAPEVVTDEVGGEVRLLRVALPAGGEETLADWLRRCAVDVVVCTGSRRNVSIWEPWMDSAADLVRASVQLGVPTLAICFGHQLLCHALGGKVSRASFRTDAVFDLQLTDFGADDPLFAGLPEPIALFTHQDHVVGLPDCSQLLATAPHNEQIAVRITDSRGAPLNAWGVQFHPEAAEHRIRRSLALGHISAAELHAFDREHDGEQILRNFADIVVEHQRN